MKVIHYCSSFSPLSETFIYDIIITLEKFGIDNNILTNAIVNKDDRPFNKITEVDINDTNILKRIFFKSLIKVFKVKREKISFYSKRNKLVEKINGQKPDIIHAHFGPQGCIILPIAKLLKIPLIVSFHGFDAFQLPNDVFWKKELIKLFKGVHAITVVSEVMKQELISLGCPPNKLHIIHVGKDLSSYPFQIPSGVISKFVSIGRMTEKKGHLDCIKAFEIIIKKYPQIDLSIIGAGRDFSILKKYISDRNLEQNIKLLGDLRHEDVKNVLYNSHAFILCSKTAADLDSEGIPTVLMEAQAAGLPCISTFHSGIPEVIPQESYSYLAQEGNIESIVEKIEALLNSPSDLRYKLSLLGRQKVESEFNINIEAQKLIRVYSEILN